MGQLSLFSRAETAAMRDRTKARNYDPERDEFRRQQRFRRGWGLQRRHAEKLRRLRESGAVSRPPSARANGQVRPVTCASRPTHRGPASRQAAPAKEAARPSAARPSAPRLPVTRPSAARPSAPRPSAPRPLEVPVSPRATLPSGGSRPPLPVLPAWDRPVLAGLRKAGPSPHAADSSAPSSAGIWPPSSGSFTLVIIAESCKITGVGRRPSEGRELHSNVSATGRSDACIVADISESKTLWQLTQNRACADRDVSRRLWNRAGPPFWFRGRPAWAGSVDWLCARTRIRNSPCTRARGDTLALHMDMGRRPHPHTDTGWVPHGHGRRHHPDTGRRGHGPTSPTDTGRRAHPAQRHQPAPSPSVTAGGRRDLLIKREASILQIKPGASISVRTRPVTRSACGCRGDVCSRITSACCGRGDPPRRGVTRRLIGRVDSGRGRGRGHLDGRRRARQGR
jgi:hypothetical protein